MVATKVGPDVGTIKSRFETLVRRMEECASDMETMADEIEDLVECAKSEDTADPHGLLQRCHDYLKGVAPKTETKACLVTDLARVLRC